MGEPDQPKAITLDDLEFALNQTYHKAHEDWMGRLVTVSAMTLTLTVSLQNIYVRANAQGLWLLRGCWIALAIAVLASLAGLYAQVIKPLEAWKDVREKRKNLGDAKAVESIRAQAGWRTDRFRIYEIIAVIAFVLAVVFLTAFSVQNLNPTTIFAPVPLTATPSRFLPLGHPSYP